MPAVLGEALRAARLRAGLQQTEVAKLVSISRNAYSRLERGLMLPSVPTLFRLCTVVSTTPNELLGFPTALPPGMSATAKEALRRRVRLLDGRQSLALIHLLSAVR
ncbi:helix-turn-helix transcriptional regulator [Myxococcus llanfairpwllgwyngyllgogerychwyrndrobwllllantysiliogogogochensis]|uniref:helix-turn-helix transcriptional regulator n=1 Tax=Myxococcus llanfairpwllgwyngyllgogerychwyrndrobwllllantysiliogogogochensis TaxID=2590453 RepID=UPI001FE2C1B1|nr:helix-turn-helix transcriptional regulator [Myxococcus llanfairpwllgwyngyllgogerychwyrndrobwllllantysiliogogogochensis]